MAFGREEPSGGVSENRFMEDEMLEFTLKRS